MKIIGGSASEVLAIKVAKQLGVKASGLEVKRFPDGERYLRVLDDVDGEDVFVLQSMYRSPDEHLFEYLLLADTLKDLGARRVSAFIPYFPYARQDARFNPGEALSPKTVSKLIESVGTDEVFAFDAHLHRIGDLSKLFKIPCRNLTAAPLLARYVQDHFTLSRPIVIGPDEEAERLARIAAGELSGEYDTLVKKRVTPEKVEIKPASLNLKGRDVLVIDDIISTGGTVVEALKALSAEGANKVIVSCTHPILVGNALAKIYGAGADAVIGTDTVPSPISTVTVAPAIAETIKATIRT